MLSLRRTILTIDAMGSQTTDIINQIVKGDYVIALKRNQPTLYNNVKAYLKTYLFFIITRLA